MSAGEAVTVENPDVSISEVKLTETEFESLLSDGRRSLLINNLNEAVDKLSKATTASVQLFGDFAAETFAPHYYYGKTLLELVSVEKELIDSKLQAAKSSDDLAVNEMKEGIKNLAENLLKEKQNTSSDNNESQEDEAEAESDVNVTIDGEEGAQGDDTANNDEEMQVIDVDKTNNEEEEDEDEDVENSQLAFEVLDYARVVCEKNVEKYVVWLERQKNALVLLGQVHLNTDNFQPAIEDLTKALDIADKHFANDYREKAFISMELTRVYRKLKDLDAANKHVANAITALETYKKKLEAEPTEENKGLLAEISGLLEEVIDEQKLTNYQEDDKENSQQPPKVVEDMTGEQLTVKRKEKRHATDAGEVEEAVSKKQKVDEAI